MIVDGFPFCLQISSASAADVTNLSNLLSGFLGAAFGGLIAALSSLLAVKKQAKFTRQIDKERLDNEVEGVIQSIYDEIETVYGGYIQSIGRFVEELKPGGSLMVHYHVSEDYFTIFNSNAVLIGKIDNSELRSLIVNTYTKGKMLLDSFRLNNDILSRYEHQSILYYKGKDEYDRDLANHESVKLVLIASKIRERHVDALESAKRLLKCIELRKCKVD